MAGPPGATGATGPAGPPGAVLYLDGGVVLAQAANVRPVLVGYTTFVATGNIGGRTAANAQCVAEFPGTHVCTQNEFRAARSALPLAAPGARLDFSQSSTTWEPDFSGPCNNFTSAGTSYSTPVALPSGASQINTSVSPNCSTSLPLACCTSPTAVHLIGYTTFTTNGNMGGRTTANARCQAEFPGTHLCTQNEFRAARSSLTLASPGAFLDLPQNSTTLDPDYSAPCNNFGSASTTYSTPVALPTGATQINTSVSPNCTTTMPLACCD